MYFHTGSRCKIQGFPMGNHTEVPHGGVYESKDAFTGIFSRPDQPIKDRQIYLKYYKCVY